MSERGPETFSVPVTVQVPREMYGRLASVARRHSVPVASLLIEAVRRGLMVGAEESTRPTGRRLDAVPAPVRFTRQKWTDADTALLIELHATGLWDTQIGTRMGRPTSTVWKHREDLGLPKHGVQGQRP